MSKRTKNVGERTRQLRTAIGKSQSALARDIGVEQPAVAAWESGARAPSERSLLDIANVALRKGRVEDAMFFLDKAGLDRRALLAASRHKGSLPDELRRFVGTLHPLVRWTMLDDNCIGPIFVTGDVIALDQSAYCGEKDPLEAVDREIVLVQMGDGKTLAAGRLFFVPYPPEQPVWYAVLVGWSERVRDLDRTESTLRIGSWPDGPHTDNEDARSKAPSQVRLFHGYSILGRVTAWFSGTARKWSPLEER